MPKNKDCNNIIITLEGIENLEKYVDKKQSELSCQRVNNQNFH